MSNETIKTDIGDDEVDEYGNTANDFRNCSFPCCGCDGARNCMAPSGASASAVILNRDKRG